MLPSFFPFDIYLITNLIAKEALMKASNKYVDFMFSLDLISKLLKRTRINNYAIKLVNTNGPIRPSKSFAGAPIFSHLLQPKIEQIPLTVHLGFQ